MVKCFTWLRERSQDWPIFVSIIVGILNTELVTPFVLKGIFELSRSRLGFAAGVWASIELCWWNYFSGWLYKNKIQKLDSVTEVINMGEAAKRFDWREFLRPQKNDPYLIVKIKDFVRKNNIDNFDSDRYKNNLFFISLVGMLKGFGYLFTCSLIFAMGLLPLLWIFALMVCRLLRWKLAYLALFTGNFLKNYLLASIYEKIGFWWWIMLFILLAVIVSYILKVIVKKINK